MMDEHSTHTRAISSSSAIGQLHNNNNDKNNVIVSDSDMFVYATRTSFYCITRSNVKEMDVRRIIKRIEKKMSEVKHCLMMLITLTPTQFLSMAC